MKITLNHWRTSNGTLERVYVNTEDGATLGYFEQRTTTARRGAETAYDRHRAAKGDTAVVESSPVTWHGEADPAAILDAAIGADSPACFGITQTWRELKASDQHAALFRAICLKARGFRVLAIGDRRRIEAENKARQAMAFELA